MEQTSKKTKFDYFIESYSSVGLEKEAKEAVVGHCNLLKASKKLKAAYSTHYAGYLKTLKFTLCERVKPYAAKNPSFTAQLETLVKIVGDKKKTLVSRKKKLETAYSTMLASNVVSKACYKINQLLTAFERACNNLTLKPTMAFYDTLADVRETLVSRGFNKRDLWQDFDMPDSQLMLSVQSTPVLDWVIESDYTVELAFIALAKFEKSSQDDDKVKFGNIIGKLRTGLCERLYNDLNGALLSGPGQEPQPNWLDSVKITDIIRGEYVSVPIGSENVPVALLTSREEVAKELAETDTRLAYALEGDDVRTGIFGAIKCMAAELDAGLKESNDKVSFLSSFFILNKHKFLQSFLDMAIARAIEGKGSGDNKHLADINTLLSSFSLVINPKNGESRVAGVMGASELVNYIKFTCPWLTYKANDGGFYESAKWVGPATAHKGEGFPLVINEKICLYPPITLTRYLTVKKQIQAEVRITNRARKRHNDGIKATQQAK